MCGISGAVVADEALGRELVASMLGALEHRGPDHGDLVSGDGVTIGYRRLAVVDVGPGGHQPMTGDGSTWMVYNGELYNANEQRDHLRAYGRVFASRSDSEVMLALYERYGPAAVLHTNAMFAVAWHDRTRQVLDLARDRLGEKPLFYCSAGGAFLFASEMKAILAALEKLGQRVALVPESLGQYFLSGYVSAPDTIYRGVRQLLPGHNLRVTLGPAPGQFRVGEPQRYWNVIFDGSDDRPSPTLVADLRDLLDDSVRRRGIADVALGSLLSGGVDSGAVSALLARSQSQPIETFTVTTPGSANDEAEGARRVAQLLGSVHRETIADDAMLPEYLAAAAQFDQPFNCVSLVNAHRVSALAVRHVTVALSGDGADEIFAGYRWYARPAADDSPGAGRGVRTRKALNRALAVVPDDLRGRARVDAFTTDPFHSALTHNHPMTVREAQRLCGADLDPWQQRLRTIYDSGGSDPLGRAQALDVHTYLPDHILAKVDRASMAHSLEVRVPFLDHRVVEFAARVPSEFRRRNGEGKWILKQAVAELLPPAHTQRRKIGFDPPLAQWAFAARLDERLRELSSADACFRHHLDATVVDRWIAAARPNSRARWRAPRVSALWAVYQLEHWLRSSASR